MMSLGPLEMAHNLAFNTKEEAIAEFTKLVNDAYDNPDAQVILVVRYDAEDTVQYKLAASIRSIEALKDIVNCLAEIVDSSETRPHILQ